MNGCEVSLDAWDLRDSLIDIRPPQSSREAAEKVLCAIKHGMEVQCITADLKGPHGWNTGGLRGSTSVLMTEGHRMPQMPRGVSAWTNAIKDQMCHLPHNILARPQHSRTSMQPHGSGETPIFPRWFI